jgi:Ca2+-binding EF-hand superfamily protein
MRQPNFKPVVLGVVAMGWIAWWSPEAAADKSMHGGGEFQMMDTNGDGKVSADEHAAGAKKMFEMMDVNKDGKVTAAEMDEAHERMMAMREGKGSDKTPDKTADKKPEKKPEAKGMSAAEKIKVVDTNGDGVLTAEEHVAGSKMMFEKMDTDSRRILEQGRACRRSRQDDAQGFEIGAQPVITFRP